MSWLAAAATSPWFRTVSVSLKVPPGAAAEGGFETAVCTRSGRVTRTGIAAAPQLLLSSPSGTRLVSSAQASR